MKVHFLSRRPVVFLLSACAASAAGCRTIQEQLPFGGGSFEQRREELVGRHYPHANRVLGPHLPVWVDAHGDERYLRYPAAEDGSGEERFYLARISDRDAILELSLWRAAGAAADARTPVPGTKTPLLGATREELRAAPGLGASTITLRETASGDGEFDLHPADRDLWGHRRILLVEYDARGVCRRARCFAVEGEVPTRNGATRREPASARPTQAARVDLFGSEPDAADQAAR